MICTIILIILGQWMALTCAHNIVVPEDCPLSRKDLYPQCATDSSNYINYFDFIIVGAGTAGCTLANKLSENPHWNILLIEAGTVPSNLSEVPGIYSSLQHTPEDWDFRTQPSDTFKGFKNSLSYWAKGKALGGSSTINAMVYSHGVPKDYDRWANLGAIGWNWDKVKKYFWDINNEVASITYHSPDPLRQALLDSATELGVPVNDGFIGLRDMRLTVDEGQRYNMAKAYLSPIKSRSNLCVLSNTLVTKILIEDGRAIGVVMENSKTWNVTCKREVILSAGAINSPKLLMLSGVGPKTQLEKLGIPLIQDSPVGRNLVDHVMIPTFAKLSKSHVAGSMASYFEQYCVHKDQALHNIGLTNLQAYINTRNEKDRPNIELMYGSYGINESLIRVTMEAYGFLEKYIKKIENINAQNGVLLLLPTLLHPKSQGILDLIDSNFETSPNITANYFTVEEDMKVMLEGIEFLKKQLNTKSMKSCDIIDLGLDHCAGYKYNSKSYWKCYIRTFATTLFHICGSCSMGDDPRSSVVDPRLRVRGVDRLRVVDSSVIPEMISAHPNIPVSMVAHKAADMIIEDQFDIHHMTSEQFNEYSRAKK